MHTLFKSSVFAERARRVKRAALEALESRWLLSGYALSDLASFAQTSGINPGGGVIMNPAGNLYGTTSLGGPSDFGTVFEFPKGGSAIMLLASYSAQSDAQGRLLMDAAGNLYEASSDGGSGDVGTVCELPAGGSALTTLATFNGSDGASPNGGLIADSDGNLYGTTIDGGTTSIGTVYEVAQGSGAITTLVNATNTASGPESELLMDAAGNLYGTASQGGTDALGAIFELAKGSSTLTVLASFNATSGTDPIAGLVADAAGNLYGTTASGGVNDDGTVFELAKGSGVITTLASFNGTDGRFSLSTLLMDPAGNLFGTASEGGGANSNGTVFEVVQGSSTITTLATFNGTNGSQPAGALSMDSAGNIYGATANGGANNDGALFEVSLTTGPAAQLAFGTPLNTPAGTLSPVINVVVEDSSGNIVAGDSSTVTLALAASPSGGTLGGALSAVAVNGVASFTDLTLNEAGTYIVQASDAALTSASDGFAVTSGSSGYGLTTLAQFNGTNGADPQGELLLDTAGNLFGTATAGGNSSGDGTVFELANGTSSINVLADFLSPDTGANPVAGLIADTSGNLYGTAYTGGDGGSGTLFEVANDSGVITPLVAFSATSNSGNPSGTLVMDGNGFIYGTTQDGGPNGDGAVFAYFGDDGSDDLADFNGTNGNIPQGGLVADPAGDLFGTTQSGGANGVGTVFELALDSDPVTTLASFNIVNGSSPDSALIMDSAGNLYGTTAGGGADGDGTVFEVAEGSGSITTLATFNGTNGASPFYGPLVMDAAGNLYGTTSSGGADDDGTAFEIARGSGVITTLTSFNGIDGSSPIAGLIIDTAGNLYGTTSNSSDTASSAQGTVFELLPGTAMPPPPAASTQLAFTEPQPSTAVVGATLSPPLSVLVEDAAGNVEANDTSVVTLTIASGPSGATLGGTVSEAAVNGVATFADLSLNEPGTFTLQATDGTLTPATSDSIAITPAPAAPATQLAFAALPASAVVGATLVPAVTVSVEDAAGDVVDTDSSTVTLTIASGPSGATLGGTVSEAAVNGVATFADLSLNQAGTFTLQATDGSLTPATSGSLAIIPALAAPAAQVAFATVPASGVAGATLSPAVTVSVEDAGGDVIDTDSSTVTLTIASGPSGATLVGPVSVAAVNGVATFANLSLSDAGAYTLTATDNTLTPATSGSITVFPAATIGGLDPSFGTGGLASHNVGLSSTAGVAVQGNGDSIIVGAAGSAGAQSFGITRYNANGSLDTTFGIGGTTVTPFAGNAQPAGEALLADGDILVAGTVTTLVNGQSTGSQFALVEYTSAGLLDTTFGSGAGFVLTSFSATAGALSNDTASALAVGPGGTIYVGGSSDANGHGLDFAVAAYTPSGSLLSTFGTNGKVLLDFLGGNDSIAALAIGAGGDLIAAGSAVNPSSGVSSVALAEFLPTGALNPKFGVKGQITTSVGSVDDAATALAIDAKGNIVVGGYTGIGSALAGTLSANFALLRYTSAGKLDNSFGNRGIVTTSFNQPAAISTVINESGGSIVASGKTTASLASLNPSMLEVAIARYTTKGQLDTSFNGTGQVIVNLSSAVVTTSLTTGIAVEQSGLPRSAAAIPFDATSELMSAFMQLTQSDQGVLASTSGGELLDVGNSGSNTVEAAIVSMGINLAATLLASLPQSVVGGATGTASVNIAEVGTELAAGTFTVELFASSGRYLTTGLTPFKSFTEKLKLKEGAAKSLRLKFQYPSSLSKADYYLVASVSTGSLTDLNPANNTSASGSAVLIAPAFVQLAGSALTAPTFNGVKPAPVSFTLTNVGNVTASAESAVQFFATTTGKLTGAMSLATTPLHLNLKPGAPHVFKVMLALPTTVPAGTYMLLALLDPANVFKDPSAATNFIVSGNTFVVA